MIHKPGDASPAQPSGVPESLSQSDVALDRWGVLRPHVEDGVPLARAARQAGVPLRTAQRWLARYRAEGRAGLARTGRTDARVRKLPEQMVLLIEGLALSKPEPSIAHVHRQVTRVAAERGWRAPSYGAVYDVVRRIDPAMATLALQGAKRYAERYDLVLRRQADSANEIWQADHTELDLWIRTPSGRPARPWLTIIEDDHSRAVAGYAVNLTDPQAMTTALALRQAIWRKADPRWHVCGIPEVFYTDHGADFTSRHLEQVALDLQIRLSFSTPGKPRGRGKIERLFDTVNQMCLQGLPGYAPRGTPDRAGQAQLSLGELDAAIGEFLIGTYNHRTHSETGQAPQARWDGAGFLPRMPQSLERLDLLLLTVARPRKVHPDGIHFQGLRYVDAVLAAYVGEQVTIRHDPRDAGEIRVFHDDGFVCRAVCPELAGTGISLKEVIAARTRRRRELRRRIDERQAAVDQLLTPLDLDPGPTKADPPAAAGPPVGPSPDNDRRSMTGLRLYREDRP